MRRKYDDELCKMVSEYWDAHADKTAREIGALFGVHFSAVKRIYKRRFGVPFYKRIQARIEERNKKILEYFLDHPNVTQIELGQIFNVAPSTAREAVYRTPQWKERQKNAERERLVEYVRECPLVSINDVARKFKLSAQTAKETLDSVVFDGLTWREKRTELVEGFFARNPGATYDDAAFFFGVSPRLIVAARRPEIYDALEERIDAEMESRCVDPPKWYREEVQNRDYVGVRLPPEEMKRYLELYDKKKRATKRFC